MTVDLAFELNGRAWRLAVPANRILADLIRDDLHLKGCKVGCDQGVCGACTVLVDGAPTTACMTFAFEVEGCRVTTIEGLCTSDGGLHPVQSAFLRAGALQCGYCTPGMILSVAALLAENPDPDEAMIREWLSANVCRCTGYATIVEAVQLAARERAR